MSESTNFQANASGNIGKIPTSRTVTCTEIVPITGGFSTLAPANLSNEISMTRKEELSDSSINSHIIEIIDDDCTIIEGTIGSEYILSQKNHAIVSRDHNQADEPNNTDRGISKTNACISELLHTVKMEVDEQCQYIKMETIDEEPLNDHISSEVIIKEEPVIVEQTIIIENKDSKSIQNFLNENQQVFTSFCGLPNITMFDALLKYIEDDMHSLKNVTKFEQLFSVLTKLHKNEDNFYLNKYIFPAAYVYTVEVLYKKLMPWCNDQPDFSEIPEVLQLEFQSAENVAIIGTLTVLFRSTHISNKIRSAKYLIAYTGFGEVFFVSKGFTDIIERKQFILESGVLSKLNTQDCVIFYEGDAIYYGRVDKPYNEMPDLGDVREIFNEKLDKYVSCVTDRLHDKFKVLHLVPDFMFKSNENICFLNKLVYVCCMLLNMLPRVTYK